MYNFSSNPGILEFTEHIKNHLHLQKEINCTSQSRCKKERTQRQSGGGTPPQLLPFSPKFSNIPALSFSLILKGFTKSQQNRMVSYTSPHPNNSLAGNLHVCSYPASAAMLPSVEPQLCAKVDPRTCFM